MSAYATRADLYRHGFTPGALANPGRVVASVSPSTDTIALDDHGFASGDALLFRSEEGGELPAPLVADTTYYALPQTDATFKVSASAGGSAINLTSEGIDVIVSTSREPAIEAALEKYSRLADTYLIAHAAPLDAPYPALVVAFVAEMAAASLLSTQGQASEVQAAKMARAEREFARLAKGIPLRDATATRQTNLALSRTASTSSSWGSGGTLP